MNIFLYWFAILHLALYALAGFSLAFMLAADWLLRRFKMKADFVRAAMLMFKARADAKRDIPA